MMETRNAAFNASGGIDCEINHPKHGWIPFTARADDAEQLGRDLFAELAPTASAYVAPPPAPITTDQVNAERDRRIALGYTAMTTTGKTMPVDTRNDVDFRNLNGLGSAALARVVAGSTDTFDFTGADNVTRTLTPQEMMEVSMQALAHVDAHYAAARALKAMAPIPVDYADNSHWPA